MFPHALLPALPGLRARSLTVTPGAVVVAADTTAPAAACPHRGVPSARVHRRYPRTPTDRPLAGTPLRLDLTARRFRCRTAGGPGPALAEPPDDLAPSPARTAAGPAGAHTAIGFAAGGEPGARLAAALGRPTSPGTLPRRGRAAPAGPRPPPRYAGVDDRACRKGPHDGTTLIDLERGRVIDRPPGRDGEARAAGPRRPASCHPSSPARGRGGSAAPSLPDRARGRVAGPGAALDLAGEFAGMIRRAVTPALTDWTARAAAGGVPELVGLAAGLRADEAAVAAALTTPWSTGRVGGRVNRPKAIKRQTFGRAGIDLLKAGVIHKG